MIQVTGDIWEYPADWICITTNPIINQQGLAVMGRGVALQATKRVPGIRRRFAQRIEKNGNVVQGICKLPSRRFLISFPVKRHWREPAQLELIEQSAIQLKQYWQNFGNGCTVVIPRPGCGNGKLKWEDVRPVLAKHLDSDNFHIIDR